MKRILLYLLFLFCTTSFAQNTEPDEKTDLTKHFKLSDKEVKAGQCYQLYDIGFNKDNDLTIGHPNGLDSLITFLKKTKVNYLYVIIHQEKKVAGTIEENVGWERAKAVRKYMRRQGVKETTTIHIKEICTAKNYEDIKSKVKKTDDIKTINILQQKPVSFYIITP